ncbi:MAG: hypothetical protein Q8O34_11980 [Rhodocyclaceae bacterium]|nr:hypothetical protein [Rhodocyclaceae bacterium]
MSEAGDRSSLSIPEEVMLGRLAQSEQMREFFIQMWLQNPALAKHVGSRMREMLLPLAAAPSAPTFTAGTKTL